MVNHQLIVQTISITTALVASGGIATLSLFDVPILQSQSAQHSLPSVRWLFSRGSHIFPQAAFLSSAGFVYLAYAAQPLARRGLFQLLKLGSNSSLINGYLLAATLSISIAPVTSIMIPTNFTLIKMNAQKGGSRSSQASAEKGGAATQRTAEDSVAGEGEPNQITDLSGPQESTGKATSKEEDAKVRELLEKFKWLNWGRAVLLMSGGIVGLVCSLM